MAVLAVLSVAVAVAGAEVVEAEEMQRQGTTITLTGSVSILREGGAHISADRVVYDEAAGTVDAQGDVRYEDPYVEAEAGRASINMNSGVGVLYDSALFDKTGGYHIVSPEMRKTGERRYELSYATATTCDAPLPEWCFSGHDVDVAVGDWLTARHAAFRILGVPVMYFPYVRIPIKIERTTGFLIPIAGYDSESGLRYRQSYYIVLAENRDATLTLDVYGKKGVGQGVEYRYIETPEIEGELDVYHVRDADLSRDYYEFRVRHTQPYGFLDIRTVNYPEMYRALDTLLMDEDTRYLQSQGEVYYGPDAAGNSRVYLAASYLQDLSPEYDQDYVVQALPEAGAFLAPVSLGPVALWGSAASTRFESDSEGDGLRHRAGLTAAHSAGSALVLSQIFEAAAVLYDVDPGDPDGEDDIENRTYRYEAAAGSSFRRPYGAYTHVVEPSLSYTYTTLDGEAAADLFDETEIFSEGSIVSLSLKNRVQNAKDTTIFVFNVSQGYDLADEETPFEQMAVEIYAATKPLSASFSLAFDVKEDTLESASSQVTLTLGATSLTAGHAHTRADRIDTYSLSLSQPLTSRLSVRGEISYDDEEEEGFEKIELGTAYRRQCWALDMEFRKEPGEYSIVFQIELTGVGSYGGELYSDRSPEDTL